MDFSLSPDQTALRDEARRFADEVVAPGALDDDLELRYAVEKVRACAERGYLGLLVPKALGGLEAGNLGLCFVLEELARADAATHVTVSVHNSLVTAPIKEWGSEEQKKKWLPGLARGELIGAYALTEPQSGSDAAAMVSTAVKEGSGYLLNGTKLWITTGDQADVAIVFARTDPELSKAKGISAFIVDLKSEGVTAGKPENKLGMRASHTVQLFFDDVRLPDDALLGEWNRGFNYALATLNGGRVGIATQAVGIAQAAVDRCLELLKERPADKGSALGSQTQEFRVAEMAAQVEAARLLTWRAAQLRDAGALHVREASMAKLVASTTANQVCRDAVALFAQAGWRADHGLERLLRDVRVTEIYEGTTEIQKLVIARDLADA